MKWLYKTLGIKIKKDEYLNYLNNNTKVKWRKFTEHSYFCDEKGYYIKRLYNGFVDATKDGFILSRQTCNGPFCKWFKVKEFDIHKYF